MLDSSSLNLRNALFLVLTPLVAVGGAYWWFSSNRFNYSTVVLALVWAFLVQLSITAGYHRLFAHQSYKTNKFVETFFLLFGAAAYQGSALKWSSDHRNHHRYVDDEEKDPYSIKKGFWWAHMLWLLSKSPRAIDPSKLPDLFSDSFLKLQHKYFVPTAIIMSLAPTLIAAQWHDAWGGLFIAGFLRLTVNYHSTFLINSLAHCMGTQTYSDKHSSRDNWFTAILTLGEGYHNFHHEFPSDYRNGVRFHHFDPTKWFIFCLSKLGLARNLIRADNTIIIKKRNAMLGKVGT